MDELSPLAKINIEFIVCVCSVIQHVVWTQSIYYLSNSAFILCIKTAALFIKRKPFMDDICSFSWFDGEWKCCRHIESQWYVFKRQFEIVIRRESWLWLDVLKGTVNDGISKDANSCKKYMNFCIRDYTMQVCR